MTGFLISLGVELVYAGALVVGLSWLARRPRAGDFVFRSVKAPVVDEGPFTLSSDVRGLV